METARRAFFHELIGVDEETFRRWSPEKIASVIRRSTTSGITTYELSPRPGITYTAGSFEALSIGALRAMGGERRAGGGTFSVVNGVRLPGPCPLAAVDVGSLQANPANRDAVFLVASNFNALETTGPTVDIDTQRITDYVSDMTQGPAASISAAPGLVLRHYFMFHDPALVPTDWRQTARRHLNLLSEVTDLEVTAAGYVRLDQVVAHRVYPTDHDVANMKVGYHRDVEVTYGYMKDRATHFRVTAPSHTVNQLFTAAVDFASTNSAHRNDPVAQAWAQAILNAGYEGIIRAAAAYGKRRVVLTLVGGGVFDNDPVWIAKAIERVESLLVDAGLEVVLVSYGKISPAIAGRMRAMTTRTAGRFEE